MNRPKLLSIRPLVSIVAIVLIIFLISSNRAWFYHRVDSNGNYSVSAYPSKVPFMWQYDSDAMEFFQAAAFFPDYYQSHPYLTGRPLLPLLSHTVGNTIVTAIVPLLSKNFQQFLFQGSGASEQASHTMQKRGVKLISEKEFLYPYLSALAGFISVKIAFFILGGWAMYRLVCRYADQNIAILGVFLLFFTPYAVRSIATYHTYEFQILTPIFVVFLFQNICESYSLRKNIVFSLIVGSLMMGKSNYASYLAVTLYALIYLRPFSTVAIRTLVSIFIHLVPWVAWTVFIEIRGTPVIGILSPADPQALAIHPADIIGRKIIGLELVSDIKIDGSHSQPGVDFIGNFFNSGVLPVLLVVLNHLTQSLKHLLALSGLIALFGFLLFTRHNGRSVIPFLIIFFLATWAQSFFSFPLALKDRTLLDLSFVFAAFCSYCVMYLVRKYIRVPKHLLLAILLVTYITYNLSHLVKLPWVNPYDQITLQRALSQL